MPPPPPSTESRLAGSTLVLMAQHAAPKTHEFSGWLLTLTGASIALVLSKADVFTAYIEASYLKTGLLVMLASALFGLVARYLNSLTSLMLAMREEARRLGADAAHELAAQGKELDWQEYQRELTKGLFWPASASARRSLRQILAGNHNYGDIKLAKLGQVQSFFIGLQFLCVVIGPTLMVLGLSI